MHVATASVPDDSAVAELPRADEDGLAVVVAVVVVVVAVRGGRGGRQEEEEAAGGEEELQRGIVSGRGAEDEKVRYEVVAKAGDELVIRELQSELVRRKSENELPLFVKILWDFSQ